MPDESLALAWRLLKRIGPESLVASPTCDHCIVDKAAADEIVALAKLGKKLKIVGSVFA